MMPYIPCHNGSRPGLQRHFYPFYQTIISHRNDIFVLYIYHRYTLGFTVVLFAEINKTYGFGGGSNSLQDEAAIRPY